MSESDLPRSEFFFYRNLLPGTSRSSPGHSLRLRSTAQVSLAASAAAQVRSRMKSLDDL